MCVDRELLSHKHDLRKLLSVQCKELSCKWYVVNYKKNATIKIKISDEYKWLITKRHSYSHIYRVEGFCSRH
ncbi:MAG TPA: hypothetical protein PLZ38_06260, partial [Spirochaetota bacterium]|nr:hypothetical protein [Spirochaetota bacterium]